MTGSIPTEVGRLASLSSIALNGLALSGPIPASLGGLTNLANLNITGGSLSGQIPAELGQLSRLQLLSVGSAAPFNRLSAINGGIPEALCDIAPLQYLNLGFNRLQGSLPLCLSQLTNLFYLAAPSNTLSDDIPPEIAALPHLYEVDLSSNLFTGPFPAFSTELDSLTLSKNLLSGPLPPVLPPLLTSLAINTNYFTGNLPLFFPLNLTYIDLSENYFTGIANVFVGTSLFYAFPVRCAALGTALSKNCFSESSKCTASEAQRNSTMCRAACGTGVWEPLVKGKSQCQGAPDSPLGLSPLPGLAQCSFFPFSLPLPPPLLINSSSRPSNSLLISSFPAKSAAFSPLLFRIPNSSFPPFLASNLTTSGKFLEAAKCKAVMPFLVAAAGFAPSASSARVALTWPFCAAKWSAEVSSAAAALTAALLAHNRVMTSAWPAQAARWSLIGRAVRDEEGHRRGGGGGRGEGVGFGKEGKMRAREDMVEVGGGDGKGREGRMGGKRGYSMKHNREA
ncbi:unnamed protein product [Closterium sp. NIES-64]|nr:unnamed protein product [Closterium sp. NIES-64]